MVFDYAVGFDDAGKITALKYVMYMDSGAACDNTPGDNDMAMQWADNCYLFENYQAHAFVVRTNLPVTTSMRAPGVVQSTMATELVLAEVARSLGKPMQEVQEKNFLSKGDCTPYGQVIEDVSAFEAVWSRLKEVAAFSEKQKEVEEYNQTNRWRKRGVSMQPIKYGMGWGGIKAAASIHVYAEDGSVVRFPLFPTHPPTHPPFPSIQQLVQTTFFFFIQP